jgi:hypothetical protein
MIIQSFPSMIHNMYLRIILRITQHFIIFVDTVQYANINHKAPTNTDRHYDKALPIKVDYQKLSPYFAFRPREVIRYTLIQTTKLKSIIQHPM